MQQSVSSILRPSRSLRRAALGRFLPVATGRKRPEADLPENFGRWYQPAQAQAQARDSAIKRLAFF